jgi:hypothetical protein
MAISKFNRSVMINATAENVWTSLKAFSGNEKFNPLVTSSRLEGEGVVVGCKRVCYVSVDGGKTESETIEVLTSLNEDDRTMAVVVDDSMQFTFYTQSSPSPDLFTNNLQKNPP